MRHEFRNPEDRYRYVQGRAHGSMYPSIGEMKWLWLVIAVVVVSVFVFRMFWSSEESESSGGNVVSPPPSIAFVSDRDGDAEIYVMNADGSGVEQLTDNEFGDYFPTWSPDGRRIAFISEREDDVQIHDIYVMNADGSGIEQLTDACNNVSPAWSPDGQRIAFQSRGDIYVMYADGSGVEQLTGEPSESCAEIFIADLDGDGDGNFYVRNENGSVELFTDYESLDWENVNWLPSWSPDGSRIAFSSYRDGDSEIYVMNADGGGVEQLTDNEIRDWLPSWSPDGGRIAFQSHRDGDWDIYVMNADGSGVVRLNEDEYYDSFPAWSPSGDRIAFTSRRGGDMGNYVMKASSPSGDTGIYVINADGSGVERLGEGAMPAWSPLLD